MKKMQQKTLKNILDAEQITMSALAENIEVNRSYLSKLLNHNTQLNERDWERMKEAYPEHIAEKVEKPNVSKKPGKQEAQTCLKSVEQSKKEIDLTKSDHEAITKKITIKNVLDENKLTYFENRTVIFMNHELKNNFGENWSPITVEEISQYLCISLNQVKGVLASLVKKNIITIDDDFGMICFANQDQMVFDENFPMNDMKPLGGSFKNKVFKVKEENRQRNMTCPETGYHMKVPFKWLVKARPMSPMSDLPMMIKEELKIYKSLDEAAKKDYISKLKNTINLFNNK